MKIGFLDNINDKKMLNRGKHFCEIKNFEILNKKNFFKKFLSSQEIFITDHFSSFLIIIILTITFFKKIKVILWSIETYSIDSESLKSELNYSPKESINYRSNYNIIFLIFLTLRKLKRLLRISLVKVIEKLIDLNSVGNGVTVIISSKPRYIYLKKKFPKTNFTILRNIPVKKDIIKTNNSNLEKRNTPYIFLAGRINNFSDLIKLIEKSKRENIIVLLAGNVCDQTSTILKKFPRTVEHLGYLNNDEVFQTYNNCLAGIALYHNETINQRFSASCKLFDLMSIGCPIITSENEGVMHELNNFKYPFLTCDGFSRPSLINLMEKMKKFKNTKNFTQEISFENECEELL